MFAAPFRRILNHLLGRSGRSNRAEAARAEIERGRRLSDGGDHAEALRAFEHALALDSGNAEAHFRLGLAWRDQQRLDAAAACYRRAIALRPAYIEAHNNLGSVLQMQGKTEEALACYRRAVELEPDFGQPYLNLGRLFASLGDHASAAATFRRAIALGIDGDSFGHLLSALAGESPARAPDAYSRDLFDDFAGEFDRRLVDELGYRVPEILAARIKALQPRRDLNVLDLGCGTGLCGLHVAGHCATLTGVDLSPAMLERARARQLYGTLAEQNIGDWLAQAPAGVFDVVLAADVFIYIGDLAANFSAVARTLTTGGLFAFSIEQAMQGDFVLQPSGRYAHSAGYIRRLCRASNLVEVESFTQHLRGGIDGLVFILRKP